MLTAPQRLFVDHRERNDGSRCGIFGDVDVQAVPGQHFCGCRGKVLGTEAFVVADHHPSAGKSLFEQVGGKSLRRAPDIVEGVIFRDHAAPAVRAEFDFVCHVSNSHCRCR
jgi:hypothetical protein